MTRSKEDERQPSRRCFDLDETFLSLWEEMMIEEEMMLPEVHLEVQQPFEMASLPSSRSCLDWGTDHQ